MAIIGTGHLSLELGGPRQFGPHGPDPDFDRRAVGWIANSDIDGALREVTLDSLWIPGNTTHGFMDFMLMTGQANRRSRLLRYRRRLPSWQHFSDEERQALATHDYVKLFELGAHPFLTLTLCIALFERDYDEPLAFQREYAVRLQHWQLPYPDIAT